MCCNIKLIGSVLLYFGITLLINFGNTELCEECTTPDSENQKGYCVPAKYCPIIGNILGLPLSRFPTDYQQFIKNSKCSSDGAENYCCSETLIEPKFFNESKQFCNVSIGQKSDTDTNIEIFQPPLIFRETKYEPSTFDLDAHPNLRLLTENKNCGLSGDGDRIGFGKMTDISEFPFMALLQYERNATDVFKCGGTLINKNYVLTAAHCINSDLFSVRLGEHDVGKEMDCQISHNKNVCNAPVQNIPIAEIHVHNFASRTKANDIALIRLKRPANSAVNSVGFVCLPTTAELRDEKIARGNVAGWGFTEKGELSKVLLKGSVDVNKERQKCVDTYKNAYNININEKYLCAIGAQGRNTTDTCSGDSGGPLISRSILPGEANERFVQYGIVSAGPEIPCGQVYDIGGAIYTNVPPFMRWILDKMRE